MEASEQVLTKKNIWESLARFRQKYTNLPFEAILKQDILRLGIHFEPQSPGTAGL